MTRRRSAQSRSSLRWLGRGGDDSDPRVGPTSDTDSGESKLIEWARVRLRDEEARYWTATTVAILLTSVGVAVAIVAGTLATMTVASAAIVYFAAWVLFCLLHVSITWRTLHSADGPTLASWLEENEQQRRSRLRSESKYGIGGPWGAVLASATALAAVTAVAAFPDLRGDPVVLGLAIAVVAATWSMLVVVYAVHYARENTHAGGLAFPGIEDSVIPVFSDYLYVATQVATSFASSDVSVRTTAMRREITIHAVIAFTFNTVVIALLVSLLISGSQ